MNKLHAIKTFYSAEAGGLVTLEDDVLSVVQQVKDLYGDRVSIQLDPHSGFYHFVEHGADGTDRLIFSTNELDGRCITRLAKSDSHSRGYEDPYDRLEQEQDELREQQDNLLREKVREPLERLVHNLKQTGVEPRLPLQVPLTGRRRRRGGPSA